MAFSAILIAVQGGLVIGLLSMTSVPVDRALADVWVGYPAVQSVDLGQKVPERWIGRVAGMPGVREYPLGTDGEGDVDSGPLLAGVSPADHATFTATVVLVVLMTLAGSLQPVARALRVDPLTAIRA